MRVLGLILETWFIGLRWWLRVFHQTMMGSSRARDARATAWVPMSANPKVLPVSLYSALIRHPHPSHLLLISPSLLPSLLLEEMSFFLNPSFPNPTPIYPVFPLPLLSYFPHISFPSCLLIWSVMLAIFLKLNFDILFFWVKEQGKFIHPRSRCFSELEFVQ